MTSILSRFELDLPQVHHPQPAPAALGFAPDIAWIPTLVLLAILAVLVLAAGAALALAIRRPGAAPTTAPPGSWGVAPVSPQPQPAAEQLKALAAQRRALIAGCVKVRALLDDELLTEELDNALRGGGVDVFDDTGQPMNPARHRVNGTVAAPAAGAEGVIAQTMAPGYFDDGRVLRPADVLVYKWSRT